MNQMYYYQNNYILNSNKYISEPIYFPNYLGNNNNTISSDNSNIQMNYENGKNYLYVEQNIPIYNENYENIINKKINDNNSKSLDNIKNNNNNLFFYNLQPESINFQYIDNNGISNSYNIRNIDNKYKSSFYNNNILKSIINNNIQKYDSKKLIISPNISETIGNNNKIKFLDTEKIKIKNNDIKYAQPTIEDNNCHKDNKIVKNKIKIHKKKIRRKEKEIKKKPPNKCFYYTCFLCLCFLKNLTHG